MGVTRLIHGDCLEVMPTLADASVDAIITDPPYPEIDRPYGRMTEAEWHAMMDRLIPECRRVLKPTGSAVFILQPNSEKVGRMRPWLWEFMAKWTKEWGMVQDAWWWNNAALPLGGSTKKGLLRPSLKACVWLGPDDCFRDQSSVLKAESDQNKRANTVGDFSGRKSPSRSRSDTEGPMDDFRRLRTACLERGGTTPFNVIPMGPGHKSRMAGSFGHGTGTPYALADWWVRYISPPSGTVLDPFCGVGTMPLAAYARDRSAIGIERDPGYHAIAERRLRRARARYLLFAEAI